jgi:hypothetical protein
MKGEELRFFKILAQTNILRPIICIEVTDSGEIY